MKTWMTAALALACVLPGTATAESFPSKPIRLVVPYSAGGTTDAMARALQEPMRKALGQPLVVDNKPGAAGSLAAKDVARSTADGHTLLFVNNGNLAVVPFIMKEAGYDGVKDFTPVAQVSYAPMVAVVPESLPVNDLRGFIELAKGKPTAYATAGIGSFGHLVTELFAKHAGLKLDHIPYKGQAPTTNAVLTGEVQLLITTPSGTMNQFIAEKRLKLLAVTSAQESPLAPGTPTVASVLPGFAAESWFAIVGPAGMPADVVKKLNEAFSAAVKLPEIQAAFNGFGLIPQTASPADLAKKTAAEVDRWSTVIRESNISAN
jgi:tripartite-type tricarboxylate transporter receptor subunit TctC